MSKQSFLSRISAKELLASDGATGSTLIARGLPSGMTSESWVLDQPEKIIQLHRDFITAGADIILTCTFGASSIRMKGSLLEGKTDYVNQKAVELALEAATGTQTLYCWFFRAIRSTNETLWSS